MLVIHLQYTLCDNYAWCLVQIKEISLYVQGESTQLKAVPEQFAVLLRCEVRSALRHISNKLKNSGDARGCIARFAH